MAPMALSIQPWPLKRAWEKNSIFFWHHCLIKTRKSKPKKWKIRRHSWIPQNWENFMFLIKQKKKRAKNGPFFFPLFCLIKKNVIERISRFHSFSGCHPKIPRAFCNVYMWFCEAPAHFSDNQSPMPALMRTTTSSAFVLGNEGVLWFWNLMDVHHLNCSLPFGFTITNRVQIHTSQYKV